VTGPPGAGKTTVARPLSAHFDRAVHLESDFFFRSISAGYLQPWKPESHGQNASVMEIVAGVAVGYADAGYFTIVEGIFAPRWFLEPVRDALRTAGHGVACAVLQASLATCMTRLSQRGAADLPDANVIEQLWLEFVELGGLESHTIDGDTIDAESSVAEILTRLRAGELAI